MFCRQFGIPNGRITLRKFAVGEAPCRNLGLGPGQGRVCDPVGLWPRQRPLHRAAHHHLGLQGCFSLARHRRAAALPPLAPERHPLQQDGRAAGKAWQQPRQGLHLRVAPPDAGPGPRNLLPRLLARQAREGAEPAGGRAQLGRQRQRHRRHQRPSQPRVIGAVPATIPGTPLRRSNAADSFPGSCSTYRRIFNLDRRGKIRKACLL